MGVKFLEKFIRTEVPDGCFSVNIPSEIRAASKDTKDTPTIVIQFQTLYQPISEMDLTGIVCGGRFEYAYQVMEHFLSRLYCLGVTLVFFNNGPPVDDSKDSTSWTESQNEKYERQLQIVDAIDRDEDLRQVVHRNRWNIPNNTLYPIKMLARRYGQFKVSNAKKCQKEMIAYANQVGAMAVISNDTNCLIYGGDWRFWSAKDINFDKGTTVEFNRTALLRHLNLQRKQMPLFATLSGNDFIKYDEVSQLHSRMGNNAMQKFHGLAELVRSGASRDMVSEICGKAANEDLRRRFQASLDSYDTRTGFNIAPIIDTSH